MVDDLTVRQTSDGFVMVERRNSHGAFLRVSPTNGKVKIVTPSVQVSPLTFFCIQSFPLCHQATASLGEASHFFLRSGQKRLHYDGNSGAFVVRSSGQSAGFDEQGNLKIY